GELSIWSRFWFAGLITTSGVRPRNGWGGCSHEKSSEEIARNTWSCWFPALAPRCTAANLRLQLAGCQSRCKSTQQPDGAYVTRHALASLSQGGDAETRGCILEH